MDITLFNDFNSTYCLPGTIEDVVRMIREDLETMRLTDSYRSTGLRDIKQHSRLFAVACRFQGGKSNKHIAGLTGLSLVDIDHTDEPGQLAELKGKACGDPHTLLCYQTISGSGLRIIYAYELNSGFSLQQQKLFYPKAFAYGNGYYERLLGVASDRQCKNVTRLSAIAHDSAVYYNPDAQPFTAEDIEQAARTEADVGKQRKKIAREMQRIQNCFDETIRAEVEQEGAVYQPGSHNDYVMRVGYRLNQFGFSKEAAVEWAAQTFPDYDGTAQVVGSCYTKTEEHGSRHGGKYFRGRASPADKQANVDAIKAFLDLHVSLRFNEMTRRIECRRQEGGGSWLAVNDRLVNSLWAKMSETARVNISDMYRVIESDHAPSYHPLTDYLYRLPPWHQETDPDYIRELSETITVSPPEGITKEQQQQLFYDYLKRWLVGMVAAWIDETVVNNVILVLIGPQGAYKTTWFNCLLPPELRPYFYTKTHANRMSRDDMLTLAQYALVCCEELDTMRPTELSQLKAVVTMQHVDERAAYAHFHERRKHIASFCATGNNVQFLSDPTGNRRWLPFEVERIVSPRDHPFNHTGIFAQALALWRSGYRYWFTPADIRELARHNRQFETPQLEKELAMLYFRKPTENEQGEFMSVARALQLVGLGIAQKLSSVLLGRAMRELGFRPAVYRHVRGYIVVQRTANEIKALQSMMVAEAAYADKPAVTDVTDDRPFS